MISPACSLVPRFIFVFLACILRGGLFGQFLFTCFALCLFVFSLLAGGFSFQLLLILKRLCFISSRLLLGPERYFLLLTAPNGATCKVFKLALRVYQVEWRKVKTVRSDLWKRFSVFFSTFSLLDSFYLFRAFFFFGPCETVSCSCCFVRSLSHLYFTWVTFTHFFLLTFFFPTHFYISPFSFFLLGLFFVWEGRIIREKMSNLSGSCVWDFFMWLLSLSVLQYVSPPFLLAFLFACLAFCLWGLVSSLTLFLCLTFGSFFSTSLPPTKVHSWP